MGSGPVKPRFLRLPRTRLGTAVIVLVVAAVGGLLLLRVIRGDLPSEAEKAAEQIGRLKATVLPVLEDLKVEYSADAAGCAILTYPRGDFFDGIISRTAVASLTERSSSTTLRAPTTTLIKAALAASGTSIERVGGTFLSGGRLTWAFFMSTHGAPFATSWSLEYDPEGTRSPGSAGIVTLTPVEASKTGGSPAARTDGRRRRVTTIRTDNPNSNEFIRTRGYAAVGMSAAMCCS